MGNTGDEITAILNQLRGLLGEETPVTAPLPSTIPDDVGRRLDALPNGVGDVIERFIRSRQSQAQISEELAKIDPSLVPVVNESGANVTAGRRSIDDTTSQYENRDNALKPVENTPMGAMASLQNKADALANGSAAVRTQMPPANLRSTVVDALAQKYYQQAKAAQGLGGGGMGGGGMGGASGGGSPLSATSGLASAPASALSSLGTTPAQLISATARDSNERTPEGARGLEVGSENHMDHVHVTTDGGGFPTGGELNAL
jgi:hypothetical protein